MKNAASAFRRLLVALFLAGVLWIVLVNYQYIFSRKVRGAVLEVERVTETMAVLGGAPLSASQMYSWAVAIRDESGEMTVASSEDRKWAVVKKGMCVEAEFYPYPPWNLEKKGEYFKARLLKIYDCPLVDSSTARGTGKEN